MAHTPAKLIRMTTAVIRPVHRPYSGVSASSTKASNTSRPTFSSTRPGCTCIWIMRFASMERRVNTSASPRKEAYVAPMGPHHLMKK